MSSIEKFMDRLQKAELERDMQPRDSTLRYPHGVEALQARDSEFSDRVGGPERMHVNIERMKNIGLLTPDQGASALAEQYRAIKRILVKQSSLQSQLNADNRNTIMVTSALAGEGKSFTAISLAVSIAMERDLKVLLVEADLIKPAVTRYMGMGYTEFGLAEYLSRTSANIKDYLVPTDIPKLTVLPAGICRENSAELISSQNMRRLVTELAQRYSDRIIIFDSSPLLLSSDAVSLSNLVGQIVLVVEEGRTVQSSVKDACDMLDKNKPIGVVLNKSKRKSGTSYGYYGAYA